MLLMIFNVSFLKNSECIKKKKKTCKKIPKKLLSVLRKTSSYKPHLNGSLPIFSIQKINIFDLVFKCADFVTNES